MNLFFYLESTGTIYHFPSRLALLSITWSFSTCLHGMKIFSSVCSNRGEISAQFTKIKLLHIIAIQFLHCCPLTCKMKSHHNVPSWNFNFSHVRKRLNLRYLTLFWISLCCVRDTYLSVIFATQSFLLLFCQWWLKAFPFPTFPIFHEIHIFALEFPTKSNWKDWWYIPICSLIIGGLES